MATCNGLLVPAKLSRKLISKDADGVLLFGFYDEQNARLAEVYGDVFINCLCNVILGNTDLILLFGVDQLLIKDDLKKAEIRRKSITTQTDVQTAVGSKVPPSQWIQHTWNIWDYYRETIRLVNLRQKQTHSTQTDDSYGKRSVATQLNFH